MATSPSWRNVWLGRDYLRTGQGTSLLSTQSDQPMNGLTGISLCAYFGWQDSESLFLLTSDTACEFDLKVYGNPIFPYIQEGRFKLNVWWDLYFLHFTPPNRLSFSSYSPIFKLYAWSLVDYSAWFFITIISNCKILLELTNSPLFTYLIIPTQLCFKATSLTFSLIANFKLNENIFWYWNTIL